MWPLSLVFPLGAKGLPSSKGERETEMEKSENGKLGQRSANWLMGLSVGIKAH